MHQLNILLHQILYYHNWNTEYFQPLQDVFTENEPTELS